MPNFFHRLLQFDGNIFLLQLVSESELVDVCSFIERSPFLLPCLKSRLLESHFCFWGICRIDVSSNQIILNSWRRFLLLLQELLENHRPSVSFQNKIATIARIFDPNRLGHTCLSDRFAESDYFIIIQNLVLQFFLREFLSSLKCFQVEKPWIVRVKSQ